MKNDALYEEYVFCRFSIAFPRNTCRSESHNPLKIFSSKQVTTNVEQMTPHVHHFTEINEILFLVQNDFLNALHLWFIEHSCVFQLTFSKLHVSRRKNSPNFRGTVVRGGVNRSKGRGFKGRPEVSSEVVGKASGRKAPQKSSLATCSTAQRACYMGLFNVTTSQSDDSTLAFNSS